MSCDYATEGAPDPGDDDNTTDFVRREHPRAAGVGNVSERRGQNAAKDEGRGQGVVEGKVEVADPESGKAVEVAISLPSESLVRDILREMWRYCHSYHISNSVRIRGVVMVSSSISHSSLCFSFSILADLFLLPFSFTVRLVFLSFSLFLLLLSLFIHLHSPCS